jgi:tetratricopeptide (TPR) repeat protein
MLKNDFLQSGFKHFSAGEFPEAVENFNKALEIDPQFDLALNALAQVYNKMGNIDRAIEIAKLLVEVNPDDAIAHTALSRLYVQKGMIKEAEEELGIANRLASEL